MKKNTSDVDFFDLLESQLEYLRKKESRIVKAEKVLGWIWGVMLLSGLVVFFFNKLVGCGLVFSSIIPAFICVVLDDYLLGRAEGRLEDSISNLILSEEISKEEKCKKQQKK